MDLGSDDVTTDDDPNPQRQRLHAALPPRTVAFTHRAGSRLRRVLVCVVMNMVYLVSETRSRVGEPGINDPNTKLVVTGFTFVVLWQLQSYQIIDPSVVAPRNQTVVSRASHLPKMPPSDCAHRISRAAFVLPTGR